jgi:hypothetical protein
MKEEDSAIGIDLRLAVIDPRGASSDHPREYPDFAGAPTAERERHKPAELCAFAACTRGTFHGCGIRRRGWSLGADTVAVLVMLADMPRCLRLIRRLRSPGKTVAVTFAEAGLMQTAELLDHPAALEAFFGICELADGAIAASPEGVPLFRAGRARHVEFIPTPAPVDDPRWDFSIPPEQRGGILAGTVEFGRYTSPMNSYPRNHLAALLSLSEVAQSTGEPVTTVINGSRYERRMAELAMSRFPPGLLRLIDGPLPALRFVRLMARHKLVFQFDQSAAVGQIAAEALMCRIPCVGGYGTTERLAFPDLCGHGRTTEQLTELASHLIEDPEDADVAVKKALALATERLSYSAVRTQLTEFYAKIGRSTDDLDGQRE